MVTGFTACAFHPPSTSKLRAFAALIRGLASHLRSYDRFFQFLNFSKYRCHRRFPDSTLPWSMTYQDENEACAYPDGCVENPDGPFIKLTNIVYERAYAGRGRDRLTILHECSHVFAPPRHCRPSPGPRARP